MKTIPGPPEPFWQQLQQIRRDFLGFILQAGQTYGDLVRLHPGPGSYLHLVNHPDLVYDVLVGRQELFHKTAMTRKMVGKYLGNGLILSEEQFHRQQRRLAQPAFHRKRVEVYAEAMTSLTQHQMDHWANNQVIDFEAEMTELTMHVVAKTLFNINAAESNQGVGQIMTIFGNSISQRFRSLPLPDWLPTRQHRQQRQAITTMDNIIQQMITTRRASGQDEGDLLSMLLLAQDEESGRSMDDRQVRDELVTLYFAGHETTAKLLTWTLYLLTQHPAVEAQVRAELDRVLSGRCPTVADLPQLTYLDQVLKETLRLYPPAWVFDRMPVQDVELGGYPLKKGVTLYISPYVSHRDPRYFDQPEQFRPERFAPGWDKNLPRYAYYPFGGGPRVCIGQAFAEMEAKIVLATLLPQRQFKLQPGQALSPEPGATLRPKDGIKVQVTAL